MADLTALVDDGAGTVIATKWPNSYGTPTYNTGQIRVNVGLSYGVALRSAATYTWSGGGIYLNPAPAANADTATSVQTMISIVDYSSTDSSIRCGYSIQRATSPGTITTILYNTNNGYSDAGSTSEAYDATAHAWLGWYYDATNVYWVKSPDGSSWTQMRAATKPAWLTTEIDLALSIGTNRVGGTATPYTTIDNVNVNGTPPPNASSGDSSKKSAGFFQFVQGGFA